MSTLPTTARRMIAVVALASAITTGTAGVAQAAPPRQVEQPTLCSPLPTRCTGGDHVGFAHLGLLVGRIAVEATR